MARRRLYQAVVLCLVAASVFSPVRGAAQDSAKTAAPVRLSLPEIVDRLGKTNENRLKNLQHFQGKREYQLDYRGFPHDLHAEMVVLVNFNAPSTVEFTNVSETGSKLIINRVIKPILQTEQESLQPANIQRVQINSDNYTFKLLDFQDTGDGCPYVLSAEPKTPNRFQFRGKIWLNSEDFAICRIEAEPAKNPSFWIKSTEIHHSFEKIGDFWFPVLNNSASNIRIGGRATLTIKYEDYQVPSAPGLQATATAPPTPRSN
jgi:hypothetical protein